MEFIRFPFGKGVALPLLGKDMEKHRAFYIFAILQMAFYRGGIVTVDGAEISKAQLFKEHSLHHQVFYAVTEAAEPRKHPFPAAGTDEHAFQMLFFPAVPGRSSHFRQIIGHGSDILGDRHLVIV